MIQMINQPANGITYQGQDGQIIQDGQPIYIETQAQNQQVQKQYSSEHLKLVFKHEKCVFFHTLMHILIE